MDYLLLFVRVARLRSISLFLQRVTVDQLEKFKSNAFVETRLSRVVVLMLWNAQQSHFINRAWWTFRSCRRRCVLMCVGSYNRLSTSTKFGTEHEQPKALPLWHSRARQNSVYREVAERVNIVIPLVRLWVDDSL